MNALLRVAGFCLALAALFGGADAAGRVLDPELVPAAAPMGHGDGMSGGHDAMPAADHGLGGLARTADGYTIERAGDRARPGHRARTFAISGPDGRPVTAYATVHDKQLHLIVVRHDLSGFQHVHPVMSPDGTWTADVDLAGGVWRVIADFTPAGGEPLVLGTDLSVAGRYRPHALGPDRLVAHVDGYTVTLEGAPEPGRATRVTATVTRHGRPVTDLQPYLAAYGHLVMLRAGDLGYVHVHPEEGAAGPEIPFHVEVPEPGSYRLFLDFRHGGEVHTAAFTAHVEGGGDDH